MRESDVDLLVSQVECADVILLNKCDLASPEHRELAKVTVSRLNPRAVVFETTRSQAPLPARKNRRRTCKPCATPGRVMH